MLYHGHYSSFWFDRRFLGDLDFEKGWAEIPVNSEKLEKRFRKSNPWCWRRMEDVVKRNPDICICHGAYHCFLRKRGKQIKEINYVCRTYQNLDELFEHRQLEKMIGYLEW